MNDTIEIPPEFSKTIGIERDFVIASKGAHTSPLIKDILFGIGWICFLLFLFRPGSPLLNTDDIPLSIFVGSILLIFTILAIYTPYDRIMLLIKKTYFASTPQKIHMFFRGKITSIDWKDVLLVIVHGDDKKGDVVLHCKDPFPQKSILPAPKYCNLIIYEIEGAQKIGEICKRRMEEHKNR
ncbi:MAG: hypothetical protein MNSN_08590 [Minisyncoccus archaeiphilus]|uniref:hypothetical protein n=1 Tax=Minisyncoccus archaeiphilus TaxID=3238481 RepID=UPI002B08C071|nr:MAG: hypothetical protein MNSN_08590 [Candidatus Parcubacteria bacterium]